MATAFPGMIAAVFSSVALWRSSQHTRQATELTVSETHYSTEVANWRDFAGSLQQRLKTVETQVTNGHTSNLRDDLSKAISMVSSLSTDIRIIRTDITGLGSDFRSLREDLSTLEKRVK